MGEGGSKRILLKDFYLKNSSVFEIASRPAASVHLLSAGSGHVHLLRPFWVFEAPPTLRPPGVSAKHMEERKKEGGGGGGEGRSFVTRTETATCSSSSSMEVNLQVVPDFEIPFF